MKIPLFSHGSVIPRHSASARHRAASGFDKVVAICFQLFSTSKSSVRLSTVIARSSFMLWRQSLAFCHDARRQSSHDKTAFATRFIHASQIRVGALLHLPSRPVSRTSSLEQNNVLQTTHGRGTRGQEDASKSSELQQSVINLKYTTAHRRPFAPHGF